MIFKFDKSGNMENLEGDNGMARKNKDKEKDKFSQMDANMVNVVKEEILNMSKDTETQTSAGLENSDEITEDVQEHEMELIKQMESENDEIWEEPKPAFGSLSEKMKVELDEITGENQMSKGEFNKEFNELEIKREEARKKKEANKLKKELKERLEQLNNAEEWKFENVVEIYRNGELVKYQTTANIEVLATYFDRQILSYNGELQRGYRNGKNGELLAVRSQKQINLIFESICKNRMFGGFLTVNWNPEKGDINYNEDEHTLSGLITQNLDILDGQHRLCAFSKILKAYRKNPESVPNPSNYEIGIVIELLNDDDAKSLFSEYSTKSLKISKSRGEFLNVEDYTNKLCRDIMKKSDIKVEVISTSISAKSENTISFGVFSKNIKENYNPKSKNEVEEMSNHLSLFIDSLIFTFPKFMASKNLEERKNLRVNSLTMEALAWGGYFKISTFLQGRSKEEILDVLNKFNDNVDYKGWTGNFLDKENPIFRKIMREGNKMISTSSSTTWINKVFTEYIIFNKTLEEIAKEG